MQRTKTEFPVNFRRFPYGTVVFMTATTKESYITEENLYKQTDTRNFLCI